MLGELSAHFEMDTIDWLLMALVGMIVGMSKVGIGGFYAAVIPIMAFIFGPKASTGVLVPILIFADIMAVSYYRRAATWKYIRQLLPWTFVGLGLGVWIGDMIDDQTFKNVLAVVVLGGAAILVWLEIRKLKEIPDYPWFSAIIGILGGFSTIVGNFAGPVMTVYLLSMRLPKTGFIGTAAWFFFIINLVKIPFHLFVWKTVTWSSFQLDLWIIPTIILGAVLGIQLVKLFSESFFRQFTIAFTVLSALLIFL
ncbi:MAG: sulfite exporter TauE/SafE family protein [Bacteroidota bacterium]